MTTHPIRFGIQTGQQNVTWAELLDIWVKAEKWGYDSMWAYDHFYPIFTGEDGPCLEGWTTLSALAQATSTVRLGHLVNGNTYRHPCVTAKMATTLDHVSGGRFNLGIGSGWFESEHRSFGIDFKTVRKRLDALEESLSIIKGMLAGDAVTLDGDHYQTKDALCRPLPLQDGGPPIMIGGTGRKILLRIVAQYADLWNANGSPDEFRELIDVIRQHGDNLGRDTDSIEKTVMMPLVYTTDAERQKMMCELLAGLYDTTPDNVPERIMIGSRDQCLEKVNAYRQVGVTHFIFMSFPPYDHGEIQGFIEEVGPEARS